MILYITISSMSIFYTLDSIVFNFALFSLHYTILYHIKSYFTIPYASIPPQPCLTYGGSYMYYPKGPIAQIVGFRFPRLYSLT